jgi:hypothetical protein
MGERHEVQAPLALDLDPSEEGVSVPREQVLRRPDDVRPPLQQQRTTGMERRQSRRFRERVGKWLGGKERISVGFRE